MSLTSWWQQRRHEARLSREANAAADAEWSRRKERILSDPIGRSLWMALQRHHLTLSSRNPILGWQVERVYVLFTEDVLSALADTHEGQRDSR